MSEREHEITRAFVRIASSLATGADVVDMLSGLTTDCARLLDIESAGLLLADRRGVLHVLAASSESTRDVELYQLQDEQGPCVDCFRGGSPVSVPDLREEKDRWPLFVTKSLSAGIASVHAVPLRLRESVLGTLGLFGARPGVLNADDASLGQALADVASVALVQDKAVADQAAVTEQLQGALRSRVVIEQAKGVLAQVGDLEMDQAFNALRRYARDLNLRLSDVARSVVDRSLPAQVVLDHARARGSR